MEPKAKTAKLAAYLDAIDGARRIGCTWGQIAEALAPVVECGDGNPERLRRLVVNAKAAVKKGRYNPPQLPLPGDEPPPSPSAQSVGGKKPSQRPGGINQDVVSSGSALDVAMKAKQEQAQSNNAGYPAEILEAFNGQ